MRTAGIIVMVAGLLSPSPSLAQQPPRFAPLDKAAIERLLDEYGSAFAAKDYARLRQTLQAPFVRFGPVVTAGEATPSSWVVSQTMDDVLNFFRTAREALDKQDWLARSEFLDSRMTVLTPDRVL